MVHFHVFRVFAVQWIPLNLVELCISTQKGWANTIKAKKARAVNSQSQKATVISRKLIT